MDTMYQPELEAMPREQRDALQLERLKKLVRYVYERIPFYKRSFDEAGFDPASLTSLDDLERVPFTCKQDMRDAYPFGMFAVPQRDAVRIHASSGTTGTATVVGYTAHDIEVWGECVARALVEAGVSNEDVLQVAYGYGLFTGGLGAHYGGERLGCTVLPMSTGNTARQIQLMQDFGSGAICCTPSYLLYMAEKMEQMGVDRSKLKLHSAVCGAEPMSHEMRQELERRLGFHVYDIYGLSEVMGPGVSSECREQHGTHVCEDHFIVEIIDPTTGKRLPDGEWGEVVFTTLSKECSPLVRYRTRDISRIIPGECPCGRTERRLDKFRGRSDDMLIIRGVNVFPSQVESVIAGFAELTPYYQIVLTKQGPLDVATLEVEVKEDFPIDEVRTIESLRSRIAHELKGNLQIAVVVKIVEPHTLERSEGKAKHVIDKRGE